MPAAGSVSRNAPPLAGVTLNHPGSPDTGNRPLLLKVSRGGASLPPELPLCRVPCKERSTAPVVPTQPLLMPAFPLDLSDGETRRTLREQKGHCPSIVEPGDAKPSKQ